VQSKRAKSLAFGRIRTTVVVANYLISLGSSRNRTQEADGSIPFSSTELLGFWFFFRLGRKTNRKTVGLIRLVSTRRFGSSAGWSA
jgi:hypothetical protein